MSWKLPSCVLAVLLATASFGQTRDGVYRPDSKTSIPWSINENHTLIWNGQPYMPVGARVDLDPESIRQTASAGVKDLVVDFPANGATWTPGIDALKAADARYLVRINSLAPTCKGFAVQPGSYRLMGIVSPRAVTIDLPDAKSALVVLSLRRDGTIQKTERVPVVGGKLTYLAKPGNDLEHVLLIYPETVSLEQIDWWEGMDAHRDELMASLSRAKLGPGLRGIVNPFGRVATLPGRDVQFIPDSNYFRSELRQFLVKKYKTLESAMRSWAMVSNDIPTFDGLCHLVPLWSPQRGVPMLWNPVNNRLYPAETRRSSYYRDVSEVIATAAARRQERLVRALRRVANVPVIQEWNGWSSIYEGDAAAVDGIGARITGKNEPAIVESACRATSTVLRWSSRGWLAATDVDPESPAEEIWPVGPRAIYYRTATATQLKAIASATPDVAWASQSPQPLFYPEAAANPASPQHLPGNRYWIPSPSEGNRIDLGSQFSAYRIRLPSGPQVVIWTKTPKRYKMRVANPKLVEFTNLDGTHPKSKVVNGGVEVDLSEYPTIMTGSDEYPVPEEAFLETAAQFEALISEADRLHRDISEERLFFIDYFKAYEKAPAGSLALMRQTVYRTTHKLGLAWWFEAESTSDSNFGDTATVSGCSNLGALELHQPVTLPETGFYAQFNLQPSRDTYEVWLAAKIAPERRNDLSVVVGSQILGISSPPIGVYGNGYGWYKLGQVQLSGGAQKLRIVVNPTMFADVSVDSIVMTLLPFTPDGLIHPDPRRGSR